jgi:alpha-glucosidase
MTDVVRFLRSVADDYPGRLLLGEAYLPVKRLARYIDPADGLQRAFDFELTHIDWDAEALRRTIERAERFTPSDAEPTWALSNHDLSRHGTRFGERRSRLAGLLLMAMRGTICLYAGEEIGMLDAAALDGPAQDRFGRDLQRTPMQWDASPSGGFTKGRPWLALSDPAVRNVAAQAEDPESMLSLYRHLLSLRRESPALRHGALHLVPDLAEEVVAWTRSSGKERILLVANMGDDSATVDLSGLAAPGEVVAATGTRQGSVDLGELRLDALEGLLVRL